ncbi:uncharacterized protein RHOBADRAFT_28192 [Rhodotorula graminis WP1]|uniref:Purine nucleoside permease n=1 Tax=Rhodotorula graminis (strain WP1) TaxID=578459 RepID=A0A0P9F268_RHOGW|nr:uncharacterized protein RHOBADRAFT_28192 [Rhodotorula graminis WP1]KPV73807.1 hypothetical protein RHOBADRAFT_28192 [Rhodotorula graminis WP1]
MIISMFTPEREVWLQDGALDQPLEVEYPFNGASPLFPTINCDRNRDVCIITTGEAEINAATTIMAMTLNTQFDLTSTYFLIAGIGGVNPHLGTLGTAAFARFSVQSGLAYELDARQMPSNWTTGYWALGTKAPGQLPDVSSLYGTEVFELNTNLLDRVMNLTQGVKLNDSSVAQQYRKKFDFAPANEGPVVTSCDTLCSDAYFAGTLLAETWGNYTELMTAGKGRYCTTAQEDNATLEAMVRAHKAGLVDYSRIVLLRTASDFDRAPKQSDDAYTAFEAEQGGFEPAIQNLVIAGRPVVDDIVAKWDSTYESGIAPQAGLNGSFYGDVFATIRKGEAQARMRSRRSSIVAKMPSSA